MTRLAVILLLTLLLPQLAPAKRTAPVNVAPVIYEGIRYVAPNDDGRRGYIEAWNVGTNKKLWDGQSLLMVSIQTSRRTFSGCSSTH